MTERPEAPAEDTVWFDTTAGHLTVYRDGRWQLAENVDMTGWSSPPSTVLIADVVPVWADMVAAAGAALQEAFSWIRDAAAAAGVVALPEDPRERALQARRNRGTGPALPGMDGRRRR